LHYDYADGLLFQVHGSKRIRLIPHSQRPNLYPFPPSATIGWWFSQVDLDTRDYETYPRLQQALQHMVEVHLAEREILLIPCGWWHENEGVGDVMVCSINQFFAPRPWWRGMALAPNPLLIAFSEKLRSLQDMTGLRTKVRSKVVGTTKDPTAVTRALLDRYAIEGWYQTELSWTAANRFAMRFNGKDIPVETAQIDASTVKWILHGAKAGPVSGSIVFFVQPAAASSGSSVRAIHFDLLPSLSKYVQGRLNHSLASLKDYLETGEGDPYLAT
jgi:hypothetical protein